ncbi:hypothetical protein BJ508DRAFT_324099 [Ascobolus immersus RN42]|uniref:Uncharacterized protein n=1 Tax=Ascobolus immersus RN42 TaxID=1160509 RepID=A0A3N4IHX2_ASCIM|nr:hypothetical protein BJ508DRAFT_324099 [Ascobolus immersus RN42]
MAAVTTRCSAAKRTKPSPRPPRNTKSASTLKTATSRQSPPRKSQPGMEGSEQEEKDEQEEDEEETPPATAPAKLRRGKVPGAQAFNDNDKSGLLDIVSELYNSRALVETRKVREPKYLKNQYYLLCRMRKPTGDPNRHPLVARAYQIEEEIESAASMGAIDDDPNDDNENYDWPESDNETTGIKPARTTAPKPASVTRLRTPGDIIKN